MSEAEHSWYVARNDDYNWHWYCTCKAGSGGWTTEGAATEDGYKHEGADLASLLAEVDRLRNVEKQVSELASEWDRFGLTGAAQRLRHILGEVEQQ